MKISRRTHPQARPDAAPPPAPTGIDYLRLLAEQRDRELGGAPIDYADLAAPAPATDTDTDTDDGSRA